MGNFCAFQFWQRVLKVIITHLCALLDYDIFRFFLTSLVVCLCIGQVPS